jgi:hypothetical protein
VPTLSRVGSVVRQPEQGICVLDGGRDVGSADAGGTELSVQVGDLVTELTIVVVEFTDAFVGEGEALPKRGLGLPAALLTNTERRNSAAPLSSATISANLLRNIRAGQSLVNTAALA